MSTLKQLFVAIILTIMLAGTALADCPNPGEMSGPPCVPSQQLIDDTANQANTVASVSQAIEDAVLDALTGGLENLLTVN
jgi:hypothetical protein